ncbi:MAG: T9SS type A sorting domain-containing protein [Flavobacteriales bacterium]|nr:T9SS type A sorting domain-containing protein [Flavobacteriales bacterium]MCL4282898.1 T9SS type A sorting domain-containing protein [Flavobacteriales bacterium]
MRTSYALSLLSSVLLASATANAQTPWITLTNEGGEVVNGTTIQIDAELGGMVQLLGMGLHAENTGGVERLINVKRYETSVLHGTVNYFCWDLCYGEQNAGALPLWVGADPIPMPAGALANGFHAYYKPMGVAGVSTFRYVWYDMDVPNDSTWVDFVFNVTEPAGIAEVSSVRGFSAYPNPVASGDVTFSYDLGQSAAGTRLSVYNMLGERKLVRELGAAQGQVVLRADQLGAGVWFAALERNGKPLATKRVVVVR